MSLLTERSTPPKMLGKRMFEDGDYQSRKITSPFKRSNAILSRNFPSNCGPLAPKKEQEGHDTSQFKRSNASLSRNFPSNCGPLAPKKEQESHDFSRGERSLNPARNEIVIAAEPLSVFAPPEVDLEYMKRNVLNDFKVDNAQQNFSAKDNEKFDPAEALGKGKSGKAGRDDVLPKGSGELADLKVSSEAMKFDSKYPLPKIRKGVTISRSFPPNCGEDHVTFRRVAVDNGRANSESKPCKVIAENNDKSIEDDNQDCLIIGELKCVSDGNVVKDQHESSAVIGNTPSNNVEEPYRCDFDWKEDETNDMETCIVTPSKWYQSQSGSKRQNLSKKGMGDEPLIKEMEKHCEEYSTYARIENYNEDPNAEGYGTDPNAEGLKNLSMVPYDAVKTIVARNGVQQALKLFEELYTKLSRKYKVESKGGRVTKQIHTEAAIILRKEQKWVNVEPIFGHVHGVEVGDKFQFRVQLAMVGLHHEFICGINCVTVNEKKYANSVVDSGRYENKVLSRDVILYSGQGGNPKVLSLQGKSEDQKLEGGNLALKHSKDANLPVRVIRKIIQGNRKMYIYEGLYNITNFWQEKTRSHKLAFMFELVRISGQPEGNYQEINDPRTSIGCLEQKSNHAAEDDVSQGKEKIPIRIVNAMSDEKPQPFTYITEMQYPDWYRLSAPRGCDCIDGCSDSKPCYCAHQNGGEIPFNEEGFIIKAKRLVHECGPLCKCPPSCQNRISQRGPRFQLEIFKTKSTGWGVRPREDILSGSFICEYIGEVLPGKEAEERINDEYLFDLDDCDDFTIDAAEYGNVGRFINHSCSPNLYAQNVVYDNDDKRLPHIMLFATKKIPALQELSYDYNYKIDRVCDAKGNIKRKICHCGSRKCTGRMY